LASQLQRAWELAYGTAPTEENSKLLQAYVLNQEAVFQKQDPKIDKAKARQQALASACQAILSANPFIYIE
jgi:hypothetical protein